MLTPFLRSSLTLPTLRAVAMNGVAAVTTLPVGDVLAVPASSVQVAVSVAVSTESCATLRVVVPYSEVSGLLPAAMLLTVAPTMTQWSSVDANGTLPSAMLCAPLNAHEYCPAFGLLAATVVVRGMPPWARIWAAVRVPLNSPKRVTDPDLVNVTLPAVGVNLS